MGFQVLTVFYLSERITGEEGLFVQAFDHHLLAVAIGDQDAVVDRLGADINSSRNHDPVALGWFEIVNKIEALAEVEQVAASSSFEVVISRSANKNIGTATASIWSSPARP